MTPFRVVYDHPSFLIINKSAGISVHKDEADQGLVELIKQTTKEPELYLVHRLDKPTSGLLILAKSTQANSQLSQLFQKREVEKYYLAISLSKPSKKQGIIVGDMEKSRRGAWKLMRTTVNPSKTRFLSFPLAGEGRLFLVKPYTGKTHQIRVALKSIGAPVAGDPIYSDGSKQEGEGAFDRCYLHAYALRFKFEGQQISIVCKPEEGERFNSEAFSDVITQLQAPWECRWGKPL